MTAEPVRILVADDHQLFRAGVRAQLDMVSGFEVVADVGTTEEVVCAAADLLPDVVLMDLRMPTAGGIEATRTLVRDSPHIQVLVLTIAEDDNSIFAALRAGARGYVLKAVSSEALVRAVDAVAHGESIFSPSIARRITGFFESSARSEGPIDAFPVLTVREREILDLIARGRSNAELARALRLSPKTVRNHISNIFAKLQVVDRSMAIVRAREAGLGLTPAGGAEHR
jgi:DNA-binding NarL/FixJ family response regulator